ncbi:MAG: hypothetical protein WA982_10635 [Rubrobacteraceae bacterium]
MSASRKGIIWGLTSTIVGVGIVVALFLASGGAGTGWHSPMPLLIRAVLIGLAFGIGAYLVGRRG